MVDPTASFIIGHRNIFSASKNPQTIEDYLVKEVSAENIIFSPFPPAVLPQVHINRLGLSPKVPARKVATDH